jgi:hypothetical protein
MRAHRGRTKKLITAFHFQLGTSGRWECGACRKKGLNHARKCGWGPAAETNPQVECPKSGTSGESLRWLELFGSCLRFGFGNCKEMEARDAEAMTLLWDEWKAETEHARRHTESGR